MKYADIMGLHEYFQPVYNMEDESQDYWRQFIPNEQFYNLLDTTMAALESAEPKQKKSLWIQGAYGTGKSHASGVIKHLLWDNHDLIDDYLNSMENVQLRQKIKNYRSGHKIVPVVLIGVGNITNNRTLALEIERAVKKSLAQYGISVRTKSDFERMLDKLETDDYLSISWDTIIRENDELNIIVGDKNDIVERLKNYDVDILSILENIFDSRGHHFSHEKISKWLAEVTDEIVRQQKASGMMILWDEFTPLLELENSSGILEQIQDIAELSRSKNVFLYLISHRRPSQTKNLAQEDIDKIRGRFHDIHYSMEPITTYHIMAASIKKYTGWKEQKENVYDRDNSLDELINRITGNQSKSAKDELRNLYPIHPYSAYLSTFISRDLGSTERSIFTFLYDAKNGFAHFITNEIKDGSLLTPDYLWDFFLNEFENDPQARFSQILDKYRLYENKLKAVGEHYARVFKGILILNILYKVVETGSEENSLVNPSFDNITSLFKSSDIEPEVAGVLGYIDKKEIIQKNPDDLFLIAFTDLPHREVEEEKKKIKAQYRDPVKIISTGKIRDKFESFFENILREKEIRFFSCVEDNEYSLKSKLERGFRSNYTLHIAAFLLMEDAEREENVRAIKKISKEDEFHNIIFVLFEESFGERDYSRFIDYMARSQVSSNHNYEENAASLEDYGQKIVLDWHGRIRNRYFKIVFKGSEKPNLVSRIGAVISNEISPLIFKSGIEAIGGIRKSPATIWKPQKSGVTLATFFSATSRTHLEEKTSKGNSIHLKNLLKDANGEYIVDENLNFKKSTEEGHPLFKISKEIEKKFNELKTRPLFNLGEELEFLTRPPYGIYTNMPNMALFGFLMRPYNGKLNESGTGKLIENSLMKDKLIEMFDYWQKNKGRENLNVRFGSEEEKALIRLLKEIFDFKKDESINDARWEIRTYIKKIGFPLWSLKYAAGKKVMQNVADEMFKLVRTVDKEIGLEDTRKLIDLIKDYTLDIKLFLQEKKNFEQGFKAFLKKIEKVNIDDHEFKEVVEYLYNHLQEEICDWEELKVESNVKDWRLEKTSTAVSPGPGSPGGGAPGPYGPPIIPTPQSKENAIKKINSYHGDVISLKQKLIKIIEENPSISPIIERYFES
jgi:hypothetical protein